MPSQAPAAPASSPFPLVAFLALLGSAAAMGLSPVFVRLAEVGPYTSAFYRVALAVPLLAIWARFDRPGPSRGRSTGLAGGWTPAVVAAGLLFAGDLICWHLSVKMTTMANATLLSTMAPVWVAAFSGLFIGEKVERLTLAGLAVCIAGGALLVGGSMSVAPERFAGDMWGVATSVFFGLYFLAVRVGRRTSSPGQLMLRSNIVTALALAVAAGVAENAWLPVTLHGVLALVLLAWVSQVGGQGLLAYALGHLTASFSSLVIFLEAVAAALFGWLIFSEALGWPQFVGGGAILIGIFVARPREAGGADAEPASHTP